MQVVSAKVIRNKQTGQSEGYGFVEFYSRATAEKVLQNFNGTMIPKIRHSVLIGLHSAQVKGVLRLLLLISLYLWGTWP